METDWSVLLTADFSREVVATGSLVGPAGWVPAGLIGVVGTMGLVKYVFSDIFGVFGADKSSFLHPTIKVAANIVANSMLCVFMVDSCQVL